MADYEPKVMFYNAEKGAPLPGERNRIAENRLCVPVEVLFNENSTCGETTPLISGTVRYDENGTKGAVEFQEGENIILGHVHLSARPGPMDQKLAGQYADRLVVPLGKEKAVRPEGVRATAAVLASSAYIENMSMPYDGARLERHLAYGDEIFEHKAFESLNRDDIRDRAMANTGAILCGDVNRLPVDGSTLFDLATAAGGAFTGDEVREQYRNGGHELPRVPDIYKDADEFLRGEFADFMASPPTDKKEFAEALAVKWSRFDVMLDGPKETMPAELAMMHVACHKMGWDLVPEPADAAAMDRSLRAMRAGEPNDFAKILEDSLTAHPQPQAEKGYPDRAASPTEKLFAAVKARDELDGGPGFSRGPEL